MVLLDGFWYHLRYILVVGERCSETILASRRPGSFLASLTLYIHNAFFFCDDAKNEVFFGGVYKWCYRC